MSKLQLKRKGESKTPVRQLIARPDAHDDHSAPELQPAVTAAPPTPPSTQIVNLATGRALCGRRCLQDLASLLLQHSGSTSPALPFPHALAPKRQQCQKTPAPISSPAGWDRLLQLAGLQGGGSQQAAPAGLPAAAVPFPGAVTPADAVRLRAQPAAEQAAAPQPAAPVPSAPPLAKQQGQPGGLGHPPAHQRSSVEPSRGAQAAVHALAVPTAPTAVPAAAPRHQGNPPRPPAQPAAAVLPTAKPAGVAGRTAAQQHQQQRQNLKQGGPAPGAAAAVESGTTAAVRRAAAAVVQPAAPAAAAAAALTGFPPRELEQAAVPAIGPGAKPQALPTGPAAGSSVWGAAGQSTLLPAARQSAILPAAAPEGLGISAQHTAPAAAAAKQGQLPGIQGSGPGTTGVRRVSVCPICALAFGPADSGAAVAAHIDECLRAQGALMADSDDDWS